MMNNMDEVMGFFGRKLDADQQKAMDSNGNTVVSAGAGSGKTTVLTYRFIRLLLEDPDLHADNILALTFTDKAAKEMKGRIADHLKRLSEAKEPITEETRARFQREWTDYFPKSQISTLDSFCSSIVRLDCLRYGLTQDFVVDEQKCNEQFRAIARELLWKGAGKGGDLLARLHNPKYLLDMLSRMAMGEFWLPGKMDVKGICEGVMDAIRTAYQKEQENLQDFFAQMAEAEATTNTEKNLKKLCGDALNSYMESGDIQLLFQALDSEIFSKVRGKGEVGTLKRQHNDWIKRTREIFPLFSLLLEGKENLEAVMEFLAQYQSKCQEFKKRQSLLCYNDLIHLAIDILSHNVQVRRYYAKQFRKIMVDEFQDNNALQKQLVYLLGAKDSYDKEDIPHAEDLTQKIFLVGDEKQSIYRFRGADVKVFKLLGNELVKEGGLSLEMATNYRSERLLIDHFTTMFSEIMPPSCLDYEAVFKPLGSSRDNAGHASITMMVGRALRDDENNGDDAPSWAGRQAWEAKAVALQIQEMLQDKDGRFLVKDKDKSYYRKPKPNDIAILLHSTSNQMYYEKALRSLDIPYSIAKISRSMTLEAVSNDIYSVLQLLVYPSDRLAYHAVLRSPFCRLDDREVQKVMSHPQVFDTSASQDPVYLQACALFEKLKGMCASSRLTTMLDYLWYASGYRLSLLAYPSFQSHLDHYASLRQMAAEAQQQGLGLVEFLDQIRPKLGVSSKIELSSSEGILEENQNGVKIMTVHASKGLEFPIVFVPDLAYKLGQSHTDNQKFTKVDGHSIPNFVSIPNVTKPLEKVLGLDEMEKAQGIAEDKRLYYVAVTRAEQYLVLSGTYRKPNKNEEEVSDDTLLDWTMDALEVDKEHVLSLEGEERRSDGLILKKINPITDEELHAERAFHHADSDAINAWYKEESFNPDLDPGRIAVTNYCEMDKLEGAENLPSSPADDILGDDKDLITGFGTYVHARTMQMMGIYMTDKGREELATEAFGKAPKLSAKDLRLVLDAGDEMAKGFVESGYYHKEVEPYLDGTKAEVHLFFHPQDEKRKELVVEGQIDVLVKKPDGWDILDFKTDKLRTPEGHRQQVTLYKEALQQMTRCPHIRTAIVYLRDPEKVVYWE